MTEKPSRFAAWQEANQRRREAIIDKYLAYLSKTRVRVRNVTDLADLVARHISEAEGEPCNKATLLRNLRYKAKLLTYQAKHLDSGVKALNPRAVTDPSAKALLTTSQLETGNLRRELERLNIYAKSLEEQLDRFQTQPRPQLPGQPAAQRGDIDQLGDFEFRFVRTCQALRAVLSHFNLVVEVDMVGEQILDKSKRRNNVIVGKEVAASFFEWLSSQGGGGSKA